MEIEIMKRFLVRIPEKTVIFQENDAADFCYFILEGEVEIFIQVKKAQKLMAVLKKGDIFGEMAIVDAKPRSATAIAKTDLVVLAINFEQLETIIINNPEFAIRMIRLLSNKLREADEQISELLIKDRKNLLVHALWKFAEQEGQKTFKGRLILGEDFTAHVNQNLGIEKTEILRTIEILFREGYIEKASHNEKEFIVTPKCHLDNPE